MDNCCPLSPQQRVLFKKVFNECPLHVTSATAWTHPNSNGRAWRGEVFVGAIYWAGGVVVTWGS